MIFSAPSWVPALDLPVASNQSVGDFILANTTFNEDASIAPVITSAVSGKSYTITEIAASVTTVSRLLAQKTGWSPDKGLPEDKIVGFFSLNSIDFLIACWAVHRLGGICLLLHSTSSALELDAHIQKTGCSVVFTCHSLLRTFVKTKNSSLATLFFLDLPSDDLVNGVKSLSFQGQGLADLVSPQMGGDDRTNAPEAIVKEIDGDEVAFLCPTSGTSGKQKLAQLTHRGVIANILQAQTFESKAREGGGSEIVSGILPLSHSYGLVLAHLSALRGDRMILHPQFDMQALLKSIACYRIQRLYLVPTIINALISNPFLFDLQDLSSVRSVVSGSAAFGPRMVEAFKKAKPEWQILPGYGLTETGVVVSFTSPLDPLPGSDGNIFPHIQARLVREDGTDVSIYDESGELLLKSPSLMKGYYGDEDSNVAVFEGDGWLRTGDIATFRSSEQGQHLFIVDRKKDVMKVKGIQVASTDIESCLLSHPAVAEAAVISVPDADAGERPYACIVRSSQRMVEVGEKELKAELDLHVRGSLNEPYWLRKNIRLVEGLPKSHNGKALKFKLKEMVSTIG